MEKFYIVTPESELYHEYHQYETDAYKLNEIVKTFLPNHNIESTQYYANDQALLIVPTENDKVKFAKQLSKKVENQGLRRFKETSAVYKAWTIVMDGFKPSWKPLVQFYFDVHRGRYRLFEENDTLYCSYGSDYDFKNPEGFIEISGSEFYKIIEDRQIA